MRIIAHLDMDAFFAAVEERERPYLTGAPIAVGADPQGGTGRGVVSTANYPAREYGIRSATPIRKAWELSEAARREGKPPVVFVSGQFRKYGEVSKKIMEIVEENITPSVPHFSEKVGDTSLVREDRGKRGGALEQVSVDECFFDLSFAGSFEKAKKVAGQIKKDILTREKLTCSIGMGPNKLIAKIASDFEKPDGLTVVPPEKVFDFLAPLPARKIPGVGPKAEARFARLGVKTVADARKLFGTPPHQSAADWCGGKWGSELYRKFRGEDDSPVVTEQPPAKSIGEQETLPDDTLDMKILLPHLERQSENLVKYLVKDSFKSFRTIVLIVRFADFETVSRSRTFKQPIVITDKLRRYTPTPILEKLVWGHVTQLFFPFLDRRENPKRKKIRLVGVRVEKLA